MLGTGLSNGRPMEMLMGENASWNSFKEAIMLRFGSAYDDPMGDFKNLRHTGTIEEYQNAFDRGQVFNLELEADPFDTCYENSKIPLEETEIQEEAIEEVIEYSPQISLHALNGVESYQSMRVTGHKGKQPLHVLIDCGRTHNFLDIDKAKQLVSHPMDSPPHSPNNVFDFPAVEEEFEEEPKEEHEEEPEEEEEEFEEDPDEGDEEEEEIV
nr:transposon Ty3-I Gag-Pol polyprotein [Tanacetum cinerariifolium]